MRNRRHRVLSDPVGRRKIAACNLRGLARAEKNVTFVGRLGTYRYLDMHVAIAEALDAVSAFIKNDQAGQQTPPFLVDVLGAS